MTGRDISFVCGIRKRLEDGKSNSRNYSQGERVHGVDGISPCLSAQMGGTANGSVLIIEGMDKMRELNGKPIKRPPLVERMKKRIRQIPEISLVDMNIPFTNGKPTPKLKDILEKEVDEKYYLRKEIVEKIVKESGFEERLISLKTPYQRAPLFNEDGTPAKLPEPNVGSDISYCVDANYHKGTNTTEKSRRQLIAEGDLNIVQINDPVHSNNRIYSDEGISPTLNTMGGGNRQPFVYEDQTTVAYSKSTRDNHIDHRGKVDGEANTISTGDGGGNQSTQNFVVQYNRNDGLGKEIDVAATLNSSDWRGLNRNQTQNAVLECLTPHAKYKSENVYSDDGIGPCLQANQGGTAGKSALTTSKDEPYRIRKLTPVECNRLQGWNDTSLTLNFSLCIDQAKNFVNAVDRNPKLQKYANDVFQQELQKLAPVVDSLLRNHQATTSLAVENASIKTTPAENKLLTELNIRVNNVEKNVLLGPPKLEDFAVESAGTNTIGVAISLTGRVGTPLQDKNMMPVYNGKSAVNISGEEITILAEDVQNIAKIKSDTFIILNHLDIDYTTLSLAILYCYVKTVMFGSTLEQTSIKNILLTMEYTKSLNEFGRKEDGTVYRMTNTQRYKQAGNGVSSPVPAHVLSHVIPKDEKISIFSLFSGVAGTEQDLDQAQFETVAFCEFDKYASDVLRFNHPDVRNYHDVTKVLENPDDELPKCNMITGGFSCQPWSSAGLRQGFNDEKGRGDVVFHMLKIIEKLKPKYTLFENVKGLLTFDSGNAFVEICRSLSELGYEFDFEMLNSKHFGLAQNRERVFIVGRLKEP
jgi:site-specific DNA-cytosine methylase